MKIAIPASGNELSSAINPRFGRTQYFLLINTADDTVEVHDNTQNLNAVQGAGVQSAETVARIGAEAVISPNVGPKAFRTLQAAEIKVYDSGGAKDVGEAVRKFKAGELKEITAANVEEHWS